MSVPTSWIEINRLMDFDVFTLITMDAGPAAHSEPMDVEHTQDSMVDHLTSVTTPLGYLISVFWFKVLSRDMYVFGMVEELMGFSNVLAVFAVRLDRIGSEWVQWKLFGMRHLIVSMSHVAMTLDTMRHIHNPATFYGVVDA
ncbi:hypothetical protein K488DRAFT_89950 [Vararia minispora EC-137]|uniref:Uncharacterized protein n=1 Tax=Vararia minispora EC-137 TaxID=1314806 RepID=A0ACB8Q8W0_9AGAM|nr:hypothetical protein K488DRAFT_89950 [Vararia minispora EC-137]